MTVILDYDPTGAETLHAALGTECVVIPTFDALRRHLDTHLGEDAVVIGATVDIESALELAERMRVVRPSLGVIVVRRRVDTSVLADALRAGVREVVEERDLAGVNAAVTRVRSLAHTLREQVPGTALPEDEGGRGTLITVFSAKGGCGKTTLSTNLAVALTEHGRHSVCLVDLDLSFGDVAIALQLFPPLVEYSNLMVSLALQPEPVPSHTMLLIQCQTSAPLGDMSVSTRPVGDFEACAVPP